MTWIPPHGNRILRRPSPCTHEFPESGARARRLRIGSSANPEPLPLNRQPARAACVSGRASNRGHWVRAHAHKKAPRQGGASLTWLGNRPQISGADDSYRSERGRRGLASMKSPAEAGQSQKERRHIATCGAYSAGRVSSMCSSARPTL
jgi:hypothetical protein